MDNIFDIAVNYNGHIESLGTKYGSCTIPKDKLNNNSICYCVGAGEDISFDCELVKKYSAKVFIFDPTPRAQKHYIDLGVSIDCGKTMPINNSHELFYDLTKKQYEQLAYYSYGIWNNTETVQFYAPLKDEYVSHSIVNLQNKDASFQAQCFRISDLIKQLNHNKVDLLKLDIEGAEFGVVETILEDKSDIDVLYIEFHEVNNYIVKTKKLVSMLEDAGYVVASVIKRNVLFVKKEC